MASRTTIYTKRYDQFSGVDFSTDPAKIADSRSPHAPNLISDEGGYPEKRVGWRTLTQISDDEPAKVTSISFLKTRDITPKQATIEQDGFAVNQTVSTSDAIGTWCRYRDDNILETTITATKPDTFDSVFAVDFEITEKTGAGQYRAKFSAHRSRRTAKMGILGDLYIDNTYIGTFDFADVTSGDEDEGVKTMGNVSLSVGKHTLKIKRSPNDAPSGDTTFYDKIYIWATALELTRTDEHLIPINGIFHFSSETKPSYLVHAGTNLYQWDGTDTAPIRLKTGVNDAKSAALMAKDGLFLLTGAEYLLFDGTAIKEPAEFAFIPVVTHSATNIVNQYGGESFQAVNLLTPRRIIQFHIHAQDSELGINVNTNQIELKTSIDPGTSVITRLISTGAVLTPPDTIDYENGILHYADPLPVSLNGGDNIEVEFSHTTEGHAEKIARCTVMANFASHVFFAGNPDERNCDWYSGLSDPSYVPDINYTKVGASDRAILGYARIGEQLAILKEGGEEDASVFLRSIEYNESQTYFPVKQGIPNEGIVAPKSVAMLYDDPLFLTKSGVQALTSKMISAERIVEARSSRINARLSREEHLADAVACIWNGYYLLFVGGHVYVADSRQKSYLRQTSESFEYEWYYWENIPARVVLSSDGTLYFGCADGKLCRFNTDRTDPRGGYLMEAYNDDNAPIVAEWATKFDDDGDFGVLKTLRRRGSGVHIKSYDAGNVKLIVRTDHDFGEILNEARRGVFNFRNLDFQNLTFNTQPHAFVPFGRKVKDYRLIQVICRNDELNQGFGVYAIERRFVRGYFAK